DPDDSTPNAGDNPAFSPFSVLCALFPRRCTACVDRSASGEPPVPFPPGAGRCERILGWTSKNPPPPGKPGREKWYNKSVKRIVRERRFAEVGRSSRFFRSKGRGQGLKLRGQGLPSRKTGGRSTPWIPPENATSGWYRKISAPVTPGRRRPSCGGYG